MKNVKHVSLVLFFVLQGEVEIDDDDLSTLEVTLIVSLNFVFLNFGFGFSWELTKRKCRLLQVLEMPSTCFTKLFIGNSIQWMNDSNNTRFSPTTEQTLFSVLSSQMKASSSLLIDSFENLSRFKFFESARESPRGNTNLSPNRARVSTCQFLLGPGLKGQILKFCLCYVAECHQIYNLIA